MTRGLALCLLLLVACKDTTTPDQDVTGQWTGTWFTTSPAGPDELWDATLTQTGTAVSGTLDCSSLETYTLSGVNVHNNLTFMFIGALGDTAIWNGRAGNTAGVVGLGTFSDNDGAGCFSGIGSWQGRIQ